MPRTLNSRWITSILLDCEHWPVNIPWLVKVSALAQVSPYLCPGLSFVYLEIPYLILITPCSSHPIALSTLWGFHSQLARGLLFSLVMLLCWSLEAVLFSYYWFLGMPTFSHDNLINFQWHIPLHNTVGKEDMKQTHKGISLWVNVDTWSNCFILCLNLVLRTLWGSDPFSAPIFLDTRLPTP